MEALIKHIGLAGWRVLRGGLVLLWLDMSLGLELRL